MDTILRALKTTVAVLVILATYIVGVIGSLAATVVAVLLVNWWAPLFADASGNLPKWLYWFQTFDATLDAGWKDGYISASWGSTALRRFLARVYWLYRNPAYGFDYFAFGLHFDPTAWRVVRYVNTPTLSLFIAIGHGFNIEYAGRFGELKLGWKAWNYWNAGQWKTTPWGPDWTAPLCFTINPFKRLTAPVQA